MSQEHNDNNPHGHQEAEQNEIGAPVLFAFVCVAVVLLIIYFVA